MKVSLELKKLVHLDILSPEEQVWLTLWTQQRGKISWNWAKLTILFDSSLLKYYKRRNYFYEIQNFLYLFLGWLMPIKSWRFKGIALLNSSNSIIVKSNGLISGTHLFAMMISILLSAASCLRLGFQRKRHHSQFIRLWILFHTNRRLANRQIWRDDCIWCRHRGYSPANCIIPIPPSN